MTVRLAVFDCDGTLVDGQAEICASMETAFTQSGLTAPDRSDIRRVVGLSLPFGVRRLAPDASDTLISDLVENYKLAFRTAREESRLEEPLFDGIAELIEHLRSAGWALGVATGKSDRGLTACLAAHGLSDHFVTLQTADRHPSKPHPAMLEAALAEGGSQSADAVMIGDTTYDIDMARAANVRAIGVSWGYHSSEELLAAGAEIVATNPGDLLEILL